MRKIKIIIITILIINSHSLLYVNCNTNNEILISLEWKKKIRPGSWKETKVSSIDFSPNNQLLAVSNIDNLVQIFDIKSNCLKRVWKAHNTHDIIQVSFSPNGQFIATAAEKDRKIKLWQVKNGHLMQMLLHGERLNNFAFSPDSKFLISVGVLSIKLWKIPEGRLVNEFDYKIFKGSFPYCILFSPNGKFLISGNHDNTITFRKIPDMRLIRVLKGHTTIVTSIAFLPNNYLISGDANGIINVWLVPKYHIIKTWKISGGVTSIASSSQKVLAIGTTENKVILYNISNWKKIKEIKVKGDWTIVKFSTNGKLLAIGDSKGWVYLYRLNLR